MSRLMEKKNEIRGVEGERREEEKKTGGERKK